MRTFLLILLILVMAAMAVFLFRFNQSVSVFLEQVKLVETREQSPEVEACGEAPVNPWDVKETVTEWDLDAYRRQKEAWERCVYRLRMDNAEGEGSSPSLKEYEEGVQTPAAQQTPDRADSPPGKNIEKRSEESMRTPHSGKSFRPELAPFPAQPSPPGPSRFTP